MLSSYLFYRHHTQLLSNTYITLNALSDTVKKRPVSRACLLSVIEQKSSRQPCLTAAADGEAVSL